MMELLKDFLIFGMMIKQILAHNIFIRIFYSMEKERKKKRERRERGGGRRERERYVMSSKVESGGQSAGISFTCEVVNVAKHP